VEYHRNSIGYGNLGQRNVAGIRPDLDARLDRRLQRGGEDRIGVLVWGEAVGVSSLDNENHGGSISLTVEINQRA
jgi:hypothetical protein